MNIDVEKLQEAVNNLQERTDNELMMLALSEIMAVIQTGQPIPPGIYHPLSIALNIRGTRRKE